MKNKILKILQEINPGYSYESSDNFIADGLIDSFDLISLVMAIDKVFNISIPGTEITPENFLNLDTIAALLLRLENASKV